MDVSLVLQYAAVALAVLLSLAVVMQRQFPHATRRLRIACALPLLREGRPAWQRRLGRRIAPAATVDAGCGGCDTCGPRAPRG